MGAATFIEVEVEPGPACEDGLSLRFKRAEEGGREVSELRYESERGTDGVWRVEAAGDGDGVARGVARAARVEDSSDGVVWLVYGGRQGLVLTHVESGEVECAPYLVLARIE